MYQEKTIIDRQVETEPVRDQFVESPPPGGGDKRAVWVVGCLLLAVFCGGAVLCAGAGAYVYQAYVGTATAQAVIVVPPPLASPKPSPTSPPGTPVVVGATPTPTPAGPAMLPTIMPAAQGTPDPASRYADLLGLTSDWDGGPLSPSRHVYHASANRNMPIVVTLGWCTTTQKILDDNWSKMKYALEIDGAPIDLKKQLALRSFSDAANIGPCFTYDGYTTNWSLGEHRIVWTQTIFQDINDGQSDYPAGDYVMEFVLSVR